MLRYSGLKPTEQMGSRRSDSSEALWELLTAMIAEQAPFVRFRVAVGEEVGIGTVDAMGRKKDSAAEIEVEMDMVEEGGGALGCLCRILRLF